MALKQHERPAPQVHAQETRAPVRAEAAAPQHAPPVKAAPPRPAPHAAEPKPAEAPDHHG